VVSFLVEEDTNQGPNPGGSKKNNPLATQEIVAGRRPMAPVATQKIMGLSYGPAVNDPNHMTLLCKIVPHYMAI